MNRLLRGGAAPWAGHGWPSTKLNATPVHSCATRGPGDSTSGKLFWLPPMLRQ